MLALPIRINGICRKQICQVVVPHYSARSISNLNKIIVRAIKTVIFSKQHMTAPSNSGGKF